MVDNQQMGVYGTVIMMHQQIYFFNKMAMNQEYGFKDSIDPSGKRVRSMTRTEISHGKIMMKESRSPIGEQNAFLRLHRPPPTLICLFKKDSKAVALLTRLDRLLRNNLFQRRGDIWNHFQNFQSGDDMIQDIRPKMETAKETKDGNEYNDDPYMLASIKKYPFSGKISPSERATFQNSVQTMGTSTDLEELKRSTQFRNPEKKAPNKSTTKNVRVTLELTHQNFPKFKTTKFESSDSYLIEGVYPKSSSIVCEPEKRNLKTSNTPVGIPYPQTEQKRRPEENQRTFVKKGSFNKLENFFAQKPLSKKKQVQIRQNLLIRPNEFGQVQMNPIKRESYSPKIRLKSLKSLENAANCNELIRNYAPRFSFRNRGGLNRDNLFGKLRANSLKNIKLKRINSAREPVMQLPLVSVNKQTQTRQHEHEQYSLTFIKAFQFHQNQINKLILFVLNSNEEVIEGQKTYNQEKLCYFLIYRYLYERNRVLSTLRKGENCFKLNGCNISDHVVLRAIQDPFIKEICRAYMEETQLLKEEFEEFYLTIEKKYPKKERFKECKNIDRVSQYISQILMEQVCKKYKKSETQDNEQKRLKQMMEVIFLLSDLGSSGNGREQELFQNNLTFLDSLRADVEKMFKTALYLRKVGSSKKF